MTDTQMSWLHILVKDRGSSFIVILKTFLEGKLFFFSLWSGSTCQKMESIVCHCTNVLRIALRINIIIMFDWFLVTFSFIHSCLATLSTIILCQPEPSRDAL